MEDFHRVHFLDLEANSPRVQLLIQRIFEVRVHKMFLPDFYMILYIRPSIYNDNAYLTCKLIIVLIIKNHRHNTYVELLISHNDNVVYFA